MRRHLTRYFTSLVSAAYFMEREHGDVEIASAQPVLLTYCTTATILCRTTPSR